MSPVSSLRILVQEGASFSAQVVEAEGPPTVLLLGTLSHPQPESVLGPFFTKLHQHFSDLKVALVHVDLRQVVFMNSASFKSLLNWITLIQAASAPPYRVRFFVDRKRRWQPTSVHALRCFAPDLVEMDET